MERSNRDSVKGLAGVLSGSRGALLGLVFAPALALAGCSSDDASKPETGADAGVDGTAPVVDGSVTCDAADLGALAVPDAGQGDASTGACLACVRTTCAAQISDCNTDCSCGPFLSCLAGCLAPADGGTITADAGDGGAVNIGGAGTSSNITALFTCAGSGCQSECGLDMMPPAGGDAGAPDSAAPDAAPTDAGAPDAAPDALPDAPPQ